MNTPQTNALKSSNVYWGDAHLNLEGHNFDRIDELFKAARRNLDFFPIAYYPFYWYAQSGLPDVIASGEGFQSGHRGLSGLPIETVGHRERFDEEWKVILKRVKFYNVPGKFVTFPGYEWHGDRKRWGDHNVFFKNDGPLLCPDTIEELYDMLESRDAIVIPHHSAYEVGERGKDWNHFREELSPFVEVYSVHGSSEGVDTPVGMSANQSMGPRVSAGSIQSGLVKGLRFGLIASSDKNLYPGEWGCGLMGVFADELSREALWRAFKERQVFGVTGDRIIPHFQINGCPMGSALSQADIDSSLSIRASIVGSHAIDRVEVISGGGTIYTLNCCERIHTGPSETRLYKVRIQCGWGADPKRGFSGRPMPWDCRLLLNGGYIRGVEPCFTGYNQKLKKVDDEMASWELETTRRSGGPLGDGYPSIIATVEGNLDTEIFLTVNGIKQTYTLKTLRSEAKVFALRDHIQSEIRTTFGLSVEDIENPDHFWHYAPKVKVHRAIASDEYTTELRHELPLPDGDSYYYLRISQTNRQMAWTSPIWVNLNAECGVRNDA